MEVKLLKRVFKATIGGKTIELPDVNELMTAREIFKHYAGMFPEISAGNITNGTLKDDTITYEIKNSPGEKG